MDVMTPTQHRRAMAHNRGRTAPERALASALWRRGIRYYTHEGYKSATGKKLPGAPDMILPRKMVAIFVDGCFWHGYPQCRKHEGLTGEFWIGKINANKMRDERVTAELTSLGWTVLRIPEHDVRTKAALAKTVDCVASLIQSISPARVKVDAGVTGAHSTGP